MTSYGNIGADYFNMNNYIEAVKYTTKALALDENIGDYYGAAIDFLDIGHVYIYLKNYNKAKNDINNGIEMEKKIDNKNWIATGYAYLGMLYKNEVDNKKALSYYRKAYNMFKISGDSSGARQCLSMINKIKKYKSKDKKK
ncbi:MAG: tetratricopeptide repeat protein [bacterium]